VRAFRTVLADLGTNCGYVISSGGFQSGCRDAAANTNVKLVDWDEFQDEFKETWVTKHLLPEIADKLDKIMEYTEPFVPTWFLHVPDSDVQILKGLRERYLKLGGLATPFTPYARIGGRPYPNLPLRTSLNAEFYKDGGLPDSVIDATGYRDFRDAILSYGLAATAEFDAVRQRNDK
jgi:restriction system protein